MSLASKRFVEELSKLIGRGITVVTIEGRRFSGRLEGFTVEGLDVCLSDARSSDGSLYPKLFVRGGQIAYMYSSEKPLELKALAERLERVFPKMVKYYEDQGVIIVMNKVKVTEQGVVEGSGPIAERAQKVYEEFMKEIAG